MERLSAPQRVLSSAIHLKQVTADWQIAVRRSGADQCALVLKQPLLAMKAATIAGQ